MLKHHINIWSWFFFFCLVKRFPKIQHLTFNFKYPSLWRMNSKHIWALGVFLTLVATMKLFIKNLLHILKNLFLLLVNTNVVICFKSLLAIRTDWPLPLMLKVFSWGDVHVTYYLFLVVWVVETDYASC